MGMPSREDLIRYRLKQLSDRIASAAQFDLSNEWHRRVLPEILANAAQEAVYLGIEVAFALKEWGEKDA